MNILSALEWEMAGQNLCRKLGISYQELKARAAERILTTPEVRMWTLIGWTLEGDHPDDRPRRQDDE